MLVKFRFHFPEVVFGLLLAVAIFAIGATLSSPQRQADNYAPSSDHEQYKTKNVPAEERLADYTLALDLLTFVLVAATVGLGIITYIGIRNQSRETRILQRAYLNILPKGVKPYVSTKTKLSVDVIFFNAGNLPATQVSWQMCHHFCRNERFEPPRVKVDERTTNIIAPKARIIKGAGEPLDTKQFETFRSATKGNEFCWLYIWGRVSYHDGFQSDRWIEFCHRYNLVGTEKFGLIIGPSHGRQHEHGNRTDEGAV